MNTMIQKLAVALAAIAAFTSPAEAQTEQRMVFRYLVSFQCPETAPSSQPGSSRTNPIVLEEFEEAFWAAHKDETEYYGPASTGEAEPLSSYDCKWIRLTGYYRWDDRRGYKGFVTAAPYAFTSADPEAYYLVDSLADDAPPRGSFVSRRVELTAQFYDLCAHEREMAASANETWISMGGECHYGANRGMMLSSASIDRILDPEPVYLLGEHNREIVGDLTAAPELKTAETRSLVEEWLKLVERGPEALFERERSLSDWNDHDREFYHDRIAGRHSYAAYLSSLAQFARFKLTSSNWRIFRIDDDYTESAVACVCVQKTCTDKWPLFSDEARVFVGAAACVQLHRDWYGPWRLSLD